MMLLADFSPRWYVARTFPSSGGTPRTPRLSLPGPYKRTRQYAAVALALEQPILSSWNGADEFSSLNDRVDSSPLPLPVVVTPKRVVLVRHGQSTWNAENRLQGSSDLSKLSDKGAKQAQASRDMLLQSNFDILYYSPLTRAKQTAEIVWAGRKQEAVKLNALREIDLYSFQGLLKEQGKAKYGEQYAIWKDSPADFEIDQHAPVRELWYRASLAWQTILSKQKSTKDILVVAHNAVNQALICTALGLPPQYFRRLLQMNAAVSVLDFLPGHESAAPLVVLDRLNQAPNKPFKAGQAPARVILVAIGDVQRLAGAVPGSSSGMQGKEELEGLCSRKTAEALRDLQVDVVLSSSAPGARAAADAIANMTSGRRPTIELLRDMPQVSCADDMTDEMWTQLDGAWDDTLTLLKQQQRVAKEQAGSSDSATLVVVAPAAVACALMCKSLGLEPLTSVDLFRLQPYSITVVDFQDSVGGAADPLLRCINNLSHLGDWAAPITSTDPRLLERDASGTKLQ